MLLREVDKKWKGVQDRGGKHLVAVTSEVQRQQSVLKAYCEREFRGLGTNRKISPACTWVTLSDAEYEKTVSPLSGRVDIHKRMKLAKHIHPGTGNFRINNMIDEYDRVYDMILGKTVSGRTS
jgi:hypothetical protein